MPILFTNFTTRQIRQFYFRLRQLLRFLGRQLAEGEVARLLPYVANEAVVRIVITSENEDERSSAADREVIEIDKSEVFQALRDAGRVVPPDSLIFTKRMTDTQGNTELVLVISKNDPLAGRL